MASPSEIKDIPDAAKLALRQGNKIEAIKIVRTEHNLDLKDAKDAIEAFVAGNPVVRAEMESTIERSTPRALRWLLLIVVIAAGAIFLFARR